MRNPLRRKALTTSSDVVSAIQSGWSAFPLLGSGSRQKIQSAYSAAQGASNSWRYLNSPAVRCVVDKIILNIGQLDLRIFEEAKTDERKPRPDHPAALSLRYPEETGNVTTDMLIRSLLLDRLVDDNAYCVLEQNKLKFDQITFRRIPSYMIEIQGDSLFEVKNYRIWPQGAWMGNGSWGGNGTYVDVPPSRMLHWHGEHPLDPRIGCSKLDTLVSVIAEDAALQAAITELANSGLTEAVWAFRPENAPELTNRTRMLMEEDLANRLRSRNRKPIVLEEGTEFRSFGVSPRDAQMMEVRRWIVERVASEYGVPLGIVGLEPLTEDARTQFLADVVAPLCEQFTRFFDLRVLSTVFDWDDGRSAFDLDEKYASDSRLTAYVSATGRPVMLTNEARAKVNLPPVKGGDELITPLNVQVGDAPKPSPQTMGPQDPNKPPQDGSYRTSQGPTPVPSGNQGAQDAKQKAIPEDRIPQLHPRKSADRNRQDQAIVQTEKVVRSQLNRVVREHGKKAARNGNGYERKALGDWAHWTEVFAKQLLGVLRKIVRSEGDIYKSKLAGQGEFDMDMVDHYLQAKAEGAASGIMDKFREEIDDLGLEVAAGRVDQHVVAAGGSLGVTTISFAREEAAKQAPHPERRMKVWIADTERHAEYDGQTIPVDAEWPQGFGPGQAPNCKCGQSVL